MIFYSFRVSLVVVEIPGGRTRPSRRFSSEQNHGNTEKQAPSSIGKILESFLGTMSGIRFVCVHKHGDL